MTSPGSDEQIYEGTGRISVAIWSTARSGAQHRVRLTEQAEPDEIEIVLRRALAAHRQLEAELAKKLQTPFRGEEPPTA